MAESYSIHLTDPLSASFQVRAFTSNGTKFPTSSTKNATAVAADTSLLVYGKGHPNYGERTAENILHILENFSGSSEPFNPVSGQLWFERITAVQINGTPQFRIYEDGVGWGAPFTPTFSSDISAASDGDYYWNGSSLFLAVKDDTHPLSPTWLQRSFEDLSATGVVPAEPRKILRVYDGESWRDVQRVYSTVTNAAPTNAAEGDLWYDTITSQLNIYDSGVGDWISVAENYLPLDGSSDMAGNINMGGNLITNLSDPSNPQDAATKAWVLTVTGALPTNLDDLVDVDATAPSDNDFIKYNTGTGNWEAGPLALSDFGVSASATELNYSIGVTSSIQAQLNSKLDLSGGTLTGGVNITGVGSTLDMGSNYINSVIMDGSGTGAATKDYVDAAVATPTITLDSLLDVSYVGGSPAEVPVTGQVLEFNGSSWINSDYSHTHQSSDIIHTTSQRSIRDIDPGTYPNVALDNVVEGLTSNFSTRLNNLDNWARREVFTVAGSPALNTDFSFTDGKYYIGSNRLNVYVNGIKQYANERARQSIEFNKYKNLSITSNLGLTTGTYYLDVALDGNPTTNVSLLLNSSSTIGDIISNLNSQLVAGSPPYYTATTIWDKVDTSIHIFSATAGNGSSVNITEPAINGLLTALTNVGLGSPPSAELPVLTYLGGSPDATCIYPAFGTNVTQVTSDLSYEEVNDLFNPAQFGTQSSSIRFNTGLTAGQVVEMIVENTIPPTL